MRMRRMWSSTAVVEVVVVVVVVVVEVAVVVEMITSSSSTLTDIKLGENCVEHGLRVMKVMGECVRKGGRKRESDHTDRQTDRESM